MHRYLLQTWSFKTLCIFSLGYLISKKAHIIILILGEDLPSMHAFNSVESVTKSHWYDDDPTMPSKFFVKKGTFVFKECIKF